MVPGTVLACDDRPVRALPAFRQPDPGAGQAPGAATQVASPVAAVLALQRAAGNRAVAGLLARQPDLMSMLAPPSSDTPAGRKRLVPTLAAEDTARAWLQLRDGSGVDLPGGSF